MNLRHTQSGVTLVELMIAAALSAFLLLGLIQVFGASRLAYQTTTGLARVQEGSRFATDFLQRDIRMAGHMGCSNDRARNARQPNAFIDSFFLSNADRDAGDYAEAPFPLRFDVPIQGYEAAGTGRGGAVNVSAPTGGWTPALDASLTGDSGLSPAPRPGSDILVLRIFTGEAAPLAADVQPAITQPGAVSIAPASNALIEAGRYYGLASCDRAAILQASTAAADGVFSVAVGGSNLATGFNTSQGGNGPPVSDFTADTTQVFRADAFVYYVGLRGADGMPSLFRARFANGLWGASEELVEGVDTMQLMYGRDTDGNGAVEGYVRADEVDAGATTYNDIANRWRQVASVELGLVLRSPERAGTPDRNVGDNGAVQVIGVTVNSNANEAILRRPYETTIALRNRLFGN
ncbi:PilW family protein [Silanimonas sp.]|uniref:PilW family protein n=1 Tax=Silanimonas sp. TaxID=1929290 RepID=UPI0022CCCE42|nr:PilW family protein [Silanimonas sp.]MCZ8063568.1 PilW family protein [Silanimonas sp.]